jgi:hypothetical protein
MYLGYAELVILAEEHDALADGAQSGESEVINPSEEVGGGEPPHTLLHPRVSEVRSCDNDTLSLSISYIDGLLTVACFWIFFHCFRRVKTIHQQRLLNLSDRAHAAQIRVKPGKAHPVLILRHPLQEFLIQI